MLSPRDNNTCYLCSDNLEPFAQLISHSLYGKYSSSQNFYFTKQINQILEEQISPAYVDFRENNYLSDDEQFLKREYAIQEFGKKIQMLSEYYKFHRDLPTWNDRGVQSIMGRYYNRVKDVDYKKIKSILKKEQNISITTHKSFSSFGTDSEYSKKSRYSTMLNELNSSDDSMILLEMCDRIGVALKKVRVQANFKGSYYSGEKKFEQYLRKQKKRKQVQEKSEQNKRQNFGFKKQKFNPKLNTKNDDYGLKEINFASNHSLKQRYVGKKNQISLERTTANETISRQQKIRKSKNPTIPKSSHAISSSRTSLSRKNIADNFLSQLVKSKTSHTYNITSIINNNNNENLKTITEIYKPSEKTTADPIRKLTKASSTQKLKVRSNSHHNLQTNRNNLNKEGLTVKWSKGDLKLNRSQSKRKMLASVTKGTTIDLQLGSVTDNGVRKRQYSQRILRSNSASKITSQPNIHKEKVSIVKQNENGGGRKKNSVIENMLQKKLEVFKKKKVNA